MLDLTLLRHGRSSGDDEGCHEGRYDSALTTVGQRQAELLAARWLAEGRHFDQIVSSPLRRAQATATIMATTFHAPMVIEPFWLEMDNGPLAGLPFGVAEQQYAWPDRRDPY